MTEHKVGTREEWLDRARSAATWATCRGSTATTSTRPATDNDRVHRRRPG